MIAALNALLEKARAEGVPALDAWIDAQEQLMREVKPARFRFESGGTSTGKKWVEVVAIVEVDGVEVDEVTVHEKYDIDDVGEYLKNVVLPTTVLAFPYTMEEAQALVEVAERHFWNNPESYRGNPVRAVIATEWKEEQ